MPGIAVGNEKCGAQGKIQVQPQWKNEEKKCRSPTLETAFHALSFCRRDETS